MVNQGNEGVDTGSPANDPGRRTQAGREGEGRSDPDLARAQIPGLAGIPGLENADRLVTGAAGLGLAGFGLVRRGPLGLVLGALGAYLLVQSARQKRGTTVESGIEVDETITIDAPPSEVWASVRRIETWPQFMTHVREITPTGERRHRWSVEGPAGIPTEWESEITSEIPDERLSWRALPGSMVDTEGTLLLKGEGPDRTRLQVRMLYHPPAGAVGDAAAKIFRRDPKTELQENLQALKRSIEGDSGDAAPETRPGKRPTTGSRGAPRH